MLSGQGDLGGRASLHPATGSPKQPHVPPPVIETPLGAASEVLVQLGACGVGEAPPGVLREAVAALARLVADLGGQSVGHGAPRAREPGGVVGPPAPASKAPIF
eukprot:7791416-Alexandrium_andersonii.AAC.1